MYGDLLLTPEQEKLLIINVGDGSEAQGFLNRGVRFWPNGIVPYELDSSLSEYTIILNIRAKYFKISPSPATCP